VTAARRIQPPALTVECPECWGAGELLRAGSRHGSPWARTVRCWDCDDGRREAECELCGDPAEQLVEDRVPVCGVCAEDYAQGPVSLERAPWQAEDTQEETGP